MSRPPRSTTRGLDRPSPFQERVNEEGAEGPASLAAARGRPGKRLLAILKDWLDTPELTVVDAHVEHTATDRVMEPILLRIIDLLIDADLPFELRIRDGDGAVVHTNEDESRMIIVVATNDDEQAAAD